LAADLNGLNRSLHCAIDDSNHNISNLINMDNIGWMLYIIFSVVIFGIYFWLILAVLLLLKVWQLVTLDITSSIA
jgi:hypothetical protein